MDDWGSGGGVGSAGPFPSRTFNSQPPARCVSRALLASRSSRGCVSRTLPAEYHAVLAKRASSKRKRRPPGSGGNRARSCCPRRPWRPAGGRSPAKRAANAGRPAARHAARSMGSVSAVTSRSPVPPYQGADRRRGQRGGRVSSGGTGTHRRRIETPPVAARQDQLLGRQRPCRGRFLLQHLLANGLHRRGG